VITPEQAKRAIAGGPADVLLSHDAPVGALPQATAYGPVKLMPGVQQSAGLVREVAEATKPKLLLHGHWHQFQQVRLPGQETEVIGLSCEDTRRSWMVLDLPGLAITHEPA
jgi:Icc-related predicted phosphoesterase